MSKPQDVYSIPAGWEFIGYAVNEDANIVKISRVAYEEFANMEAKCQRYERALKQIAEDDCSHASYEDSSDVCGRLIDIAKQALSGGEE